MNECYKNINLNICISMYFYFIHFSWNDAYSVELDNFKNFGDTGAEWFGHSIGQKMIK